VKCTIISFCLPVVDFFSDTQKPTYRNKVGILTCDDPGKYIKLFGEIFKVSEVEERPAGEREVRMTCENFPREKEYFFHGNGIDVPYEIVSKREFTKRYIRAAGLIKS